MKATLFIPTYNSATYIVETLESVIHQQAPQFEVLVIDDASQDNTVELMQPYVQKGSVRLLLNEKNQGVSYSRNRAIDEAAGDILISLDADDLALPGRIAAHLEVFERNPDVHVVGGQMINFGTATGITSLPLTDDAIKANFVTGRANIANPASSYRLDFVKKHKIRYQLDLLTSQDFGFWIDCMLAGGKFLNLEQAVAKYRNHDMQTTKNIDRLQTEQKIIFNKLYTALFLMNPSDTQLLCEVMVSVGAVTVTYAQLAQAIKIMQNITKAPYISKYGENAQMVKTHIKVHLEKWQKAMQPKVTATQNA